MATWDDVRRITLALPGAFEGIEGHGGCAAWRTSNGMFAWEREPRKADLAALAARGRQWPDGDVLAVRTESVVEKEALIGSFPEVFFTVPHFDGYPAVLVRLDLVDVQQLSEVVTDAWLTRAPKRVAKAWLAEHGG